MGSVCSSSNGAPQPSAVPAPEPNYVAVSGAHFATACGRCVQVHWRSNANETLPVVGKCADCGAADLSLSVDVYTRANEARDVGDHQQPMAITWQFVDCPEQQQDTTVSPVNNVTSAHVTPSPNTQNTSADAHANATTAPSPSYQSPRVTEAATRAPSIANYTNTTVTATEPNVKSTNTSTHSLQSNTSSNSTGPAACPPSDAENGANRSVSAEYKLSCDENKPDTTTNITNTTTQPTSTTPAPAESPPSPTTSSKAATTAPVEKIVANDSDASKSPAATLVVESSKSPAATLVVDASKSPAATLVVDASKSPAATLVVDASKSPAATLVVESSKSPAATLVVDAKLMKVVAPVKVAASTSTAARAPGKPGGETSSNVREVSVKSTQFSSTSTTDTAKVTPAAASSTPATPSSPSASPPAPAPASRRKTPVPANADEEEYVPSTGSSASSDSKKKNSDSDDATSNSRMSDDSTRREHRHEALLKNPFFLSSVLLAVVGVVGAVVAYRAKEHRQHRHVQQDLAWRHYSQRVQSVSARPALGTPSPGGLSDVYIVSNTTRHGGNRGTPAAASAVAAVLSPAPFSMATTRAELGML
ncbi:hypothetical protein Gpo141_00000274 [Globisporangium polare]